MSNTSDQATQTMPLSTELEVSIQEQLLSMGPSSAHLDYNLVNALSLKLVKSQVGDLSFDFNNYDTCIASFKEKQVTVVACNSIWRINCNDQTKWDDGDFIFMEETFCYTILPGGLLAFGSRSGIHFYSQQDQLKRACPSILTGSLVTALCPSHLPNHIIASVESDASIRLFSFNAGGSRCVKMIQFNQTNLNVYEIIPAKGKHGSLRKSNYMVASSEGLFIIDLDLDPLDLSLLRKYALPSTLTMRFYSVEKVLLMKRTTRELTTYCLKKQSHLGKIGLYGVLGIKQLGGGKGSCKFWVVHTRLGTFLLNLHNLESTCILTGQSGLVHQDCIALIKDTTQLKIRSLSKVNDSRGNPKIRLKETFLMLNY
ncbi:hypothetical protein FGO68_gene6034 [Halteria grandinella]|uniref:Uncharacterized protein n=1 Tax=Halteria grandinella TaxID=5974 RepID=A0A8J8NMA0_HALGN|nr:hypothetical protein FGO68_gene6034 [Halteria grandinella]